MPYDKSKFRACKHGLDGVFCYCRHCEKTLGFEKKDIKKSIYHAKTTGHTVDVYRENWTEYTSFVKKSK